MASKTASAPSSRNASRGSVIERGVETPARATSVFAVGLSQARQRRLGARSDERDAEELQQAAQRAVLAARAVQRRPDDIRTRLAQVAEQRRVGVAELDLVAVLEQAVGDAAPGAQRDVAFVRDAAGEHDDAGQAGSSMAMRVSRRSAAARRRGRRAAAGGGCRVGDGQTERTGLRELVEQGELTVDDGREPADPLADEVRRRVAEREPHGVAPAAVGVERRAGRVGDELLHGTRQHRLRVHVRRQREPDVEAAVRHGPAQRRQLLGERRQHGVAPLAVHAAEDVDLPAPVGRGQVLGDRRSA